MPREDLGGQMLGGFAGGLENREVGDSATEVLLGRTVQGPGSHSCQVVVEACSSAASGLLGRDAVNVNRISGPGPWAGLMDG